MPDQLEGLAGLGWDDLAYWAGSEVLDRGKSYKDQVHNLCVTGKGGLLAWVHGSARYATAVRIDNAGNLSAECSCPYSWGPCKHSVAVILVYIDALKKKLHLPQAAENDPRHILLRKTAAYGCVTGAGPQPLPRGSEAGQDDPDDATILRNKFESMTKEELVNFLLHLTDQDPQLAAAIVEKERLKAGEISHIVEAVRDKLEDLGRAGWSDDDDWDDDDDDWDDDDWHDRPRIPDLSDVRMRLEALVESGHADTVLELGDDIWARGIELLETVDDEGETHDEVYGCMEVVLRAVPLSSLTKAAQILWIVDKYLGDDWGMLGGFHSTRLDDYDRKAWSGAADSLLKRLGDLPALSSKDDFSGQYGRRHVMNWAIKALDSSGRGEEVIPLLEREVEFTGCYETLLERLLAAGKVPEARKVGIQGYHRMVTGTPGIAAALETALCNIAESEGDLLLVAAYRSQVFFDKPSLETFLGLEQVSRSLGQWDVIRKAALSYLETGALPLPQAGNKKKTRSKAVEPWPLPPTDITPPVKRTRWPQFPALDTLIAIAIHESRNDDALRWYKKLRPDRSTASIDEKVAQAVQHSHPDEAISIWRRLAEAQINLVKPAAYQVAAQHLRKIRRVLHEHERVAEWEALVGEIRKKHKPKRKLMEILNTLKNQRIIET